MTDMKLEVVIIPVADVDRAKEFYSRLGWRLDRTPPAVVQFTPPGSACSVQFGAALAPASAVPGSAKNYVIVTDIEATRRELVAAAAATCPGPRSPTPTATSGSCRRSPPACRAASTRASSRSRRPRTCRRPSSAPRPPTARSTRSG
jgi:predicted enzyme related to lactoylglutathione lyase